MHRNPGPACSVQLPCGPGAPRAARRVVSLVLDQWGVGEEEVLDATKLVVSELVTNVLVHGESRGPVLLSLRLHGDRVRVEVADSGAAIPAQREPAATAENGRGLGIVAQLSADWGVERYRGGKRVYAELPLARALSA